MQTQYDILKQELDKLKDKNVNELLSNKTLNNNSDSKSSNSNNWNSYIRDAANQHPSKNRSYNSNRIRHNY